MVSTANGIKGRTDEYDLSYSSAKELFEACREARLRWFSTRERVNAYKLTEGAKTQKFNESVSSSKDPDVMRNVDVRIVLEEDEGRAADAYDRLKLTCEYVLYGKNGDSGLSSLVGEDAANIIKFHYIHGMTYEQVSSILCMSITSVFKYARIANETCDAYGLQRVAEGKGIANA